jgi:hypothetical protein
MKKIAKMLLSLFFLLFICWIIMLNTKLYYEPEFAEQSGISVNMDVLHQLNFVDSEISKGAADGMQNEYPEGYFFMNALSGMTWFEVGKAAKYHSELYKTAISKVNFYYSNLISEKGKRVFDKTLTPPYGIFYIGWNNYLLGEKISIEDSSAQKNSDEAIYDSQSRLIIQTLDSSKSPYPESLEKACWPSDVTVAVASLQFADKDLKARADSSMRNWISKVKVHLDSNGLMAHSVDYYTGFSQENARGSSQSLILNFLFEVDSTFARQQFEIYKKKFLTSRFGLPGIREYPVGSIGNGDIDSGPVIFDVGGAASIVGLRTMTLFGERQTAVGLRNSLEAFGFAITSGDQKKYLFGKLPMADVFIAWANSKEITKDKMIVTSDNWRKYFQLYSLLAILLPFLFLLWLWNKFPFNRQF